MTDLRTAAQQALEDLKDLHKNHNITYAGTISRLEAALAQEQPNPPGCDHCNHPLYAATRCRVCGRVTEQAEPVEPVAYRHLHEDGWEYHDAPTGEDCAECQALYTAPPQRKPLTEEEIDRVWDQWFGAYGLRGSNGPYTRRGFARAVERAHGIGEEK